jgi:hypothetical protein
VWRDGIEKMSSGRAWADTGDGSENTSQCDGAAVVGGLDDGIVIVRAVSSSAMAVVITYNNIIVIMLVHNSASHWLCFSH